MVVRSGLKMKRDLIKLFLNQEAVGNLKVKPYSSLMNMSVGVLPNC